MRNNGEQVLELPTAHLHVLIFLMSLLASVCEHSDQNKMTASSLASMIAPNILKPAKSKDADTNPLSAAADMLKFHGETCRAITLLILHHAELGVVPDYIQKMSEQFEPDEAKLIYQQLLEEPQSSW